MINRRRRAFFFRSTRPREYTYLVCRNDNDSPRTSLLKCLFSCTCVSPISINPSGEQFSSRYSERSFVEFYFAENLLGAYDNGRSMITLRYFFQLITTVFFAIFPVIYFTLSARFSILCRELQSIPFKFHSFEHFRKARIFFFSRLTFFRPTITVILYQNTFNARRNQKPSEIFPILTFKPKFPSQ